MSSAKLVHRVSYKLKMVWFSKISNKADFMKLIENSGVLGAKFRMNLIFFDSLNWHFFAA